jgi:hypothetical protein
MVQGLVLRRRLEGGRDQAAGREAANRGTCAAEYAEDRGGTDCISADGRICGAGDRAGVQRAGEANP